MESLQPLRKKGISFLLDLKVIKNPRFYTRIRNYYDNGFDVSLLINTNSLFYFLPMIAKHISNNLYFIKTIGFILENDFNNNLELFFNIYNAYLIFKLNGFQVDLFNKDLIQYISYYSSIYEKYSSIKAIFMDMDGVLINTDVANAIRYINKKYGLNIKIPKTFFSPKDLFWDYPNPKQLLMDYENFLRENEELNLSLVRQLREIKKKGLNIFIVSSASLQKIQELIDKYSLEMIDGFFSIKKVKKEIMNILDKLDLQIEEVLYIGDSFTKDIKPFYDLGMRSVQFHFFTSIIDNDWLIDLIKAYK